MNIKSSQILVEEAKKSIETLSSEEVKKLSALKGVKDDPIPSNIGVKKEEPEDDRRHGHCGEKGAPLPVAHQVLS